MGNNLAKLRGKHKLTATELAKRTGLTKQAISLNEVQRCSVSTAKLVADVLNENVIEILGTDNFRVLPKAQEEKDYLIDLIRSL